MKWTKEQEKSVGADQESPKKIELHTVHASSRGLQFPALCGLHVLHLQVMGINGQCAFCHQFDNIVGVSVFLFDRNISKHNCFRSIAE
jgi:hypothetical protein